MPERHAIPGGIFYFILLPPSIWASILTPLLLYLIYFSPRATGNYILKNMVLCPPVCCKTIQFLTPSALSHLIVENHCFLLFISWRKKDLFYIFLFPPLN